ncbi:hypothetical protein HETIRDRAFT_460754 [Heterobasidion irregulare TC 32-1]|uniref:Uncharacterized protein n=1 Tax=Heterobasidion irregulare (strain TC 32-1) TaxID=747525 RepID=W4JS44_HETIT|nr:uncharacterized protein HETIRDRAFT_460754 [Heterobasidion irregulare TC 32-1]ETW76358.1 hypothetical protein HETIRDRAFT_460754 [Heterobasidion irregulare TC 32-1]
MDSESELSDIEYEPAALGQPEYKLRSALKPPRTTTYTAQALYDFVAKVHQTFQIAVEMVKENKSFLAVTQGPTTISLLDMVMMMLVIYLFRERMPKEALARCVQGMRQFVRKEHTDIRWNASVVATGMGFLAQLQGGSEQKLQLASNAPASTGVTAPGSGARHDPPPPPPPTDTPAATAPASVVHRRLAAMRAAKESLNASNPTAPASSSTNVALPLPPTSAGARGMAGPARGSATAGGSGSESTAGRQDVRYHPYRGSSASSASGARTTSSPAVQQGGDVRMKDEFGAHAMGWDGMGCGSAMGVEGWMGDDGRRGVWLMGSAWTEGAERDDT